MPKPIGHFHILMKFFLKKTEDLCCWGMGTCLHSRLPSEMKLKPYMQNGRDLYFLYNTLEIL